MVSKQILTFGKTATNYDATVVLICFEWPQKRANTIKNRNCADNPEAFVTETWLVWHWKVLLLPPHVLPRKNITTLPFVRSSY